MSKQIQLVFLKNDQALDARSKAPRDVEHILQQAGYEPYHQSLYQGEPTYKRIPLLLKGLASFFWSIPCGTTLFIQYPASEVFFQLQGLCQMKGVKFIALIHDLESYRQGRKLSATEVKHLSSFDKLIVHTPAMKELLISAGVKSEMYILGFFDYLASPKKQSLSPACKETRRADRYNICFAGNLGKSLFLEKLPQLTSQRVHFRLYGIGMPEGLDRQDHISYEGAFHPDDLSLLCGDWGLVWDGDSLDTCSGNMGEYLRINSPHKASLYLAAGIPLIVWEDSALAPLVEQEKLGIVISALPDIEAKITSLTSQEEDQIRQAVQRKQLELCQGQTLDHLLWLL